MNIIVVSDTFPPDVNGVARTLQTLARGLAARGNRVNVITTTRGAVKENRLHGVTVESVCAFALPGYKHVRVGLASERFFGSRIEELQPDAIYVAVESVIGLNAIRAAHRLGVR